MVNRVPECNRVHLRQSVLFLDDHPRLGPQAAPVECDPIRLERQEEPLAPRCESEPGPSELNQRASQPGAIEAETVRARVHEVVERAIATVEVPARDKGLTLVTEIDGAADVACSPRLVRVLQTLLVNAVRHTPADGTVRVEARRTGGSLELTVQDTGAGILPADLARVFEPFFRADAARSGPGAGLGLAQIEPPPSPFEQLQIGAEPRARRPWRARESAVLHARPRAQLPRGSRG